MSNPSVPAFIATDAVVRYQAGDFDAPSRATPARSASTSRIAWVAVDEGRFRLARDVAGLLGSPSENIVMIKANYWIGT